MRRPTWIAAALGFAAGVLVTILVVRLYGAGGFLTDTVNTVTRPPITPTKILFYVSAALIALALPLAIGEWLAERRFVKAERALRAERPADDVTAYEGPEGRGFLFDGPQGRLLLLEPTGGIGRPTTIELPPVPPAPEEPAAIAGDAEAAGLPQR